MDALCGNVLELQSGMHAFICIISTFQSPCAALLLPSVARCCYPHQSSLRKTHAVVDISSEQMDALCGNVLELQSDMHVCIIGSTYSALLLNHPLLPSSASACLLLLLASVLPAQDACSG